MAPNILEEGVDIPIAGANIGHPAGIVERYVVEKSEAGGLVQGEPFPRVRTATVRFSKLGEHIGDRIAGEFHATFVNDRNIGGRSWDGNIAEVIIYNTALNAADRAATEEYLAGKWGLSLNGVSVFDSDNLSDTGPVIVAGGTLDIGNFNETVGAVTLVDGSIIGNAGTLTGSSYDVRNGTVSAILGGTATTITKLIINHLERMESIRHGDFPPAHKD